MVTEPMTETQLSAAAIVAIREGLEGRQGDDLTLQLVEEVRSMATELLQARAAKTAGEWRDIASAPKTIVRRDGHSGYSDYILAFPVGGDVVRCRWWEWDGDPQACNFLADGGWAVHPTHWQPIPTPPSTLTNEANDEQH